jgi:hypothetical protein
MSIVRDGKMPEHFGGLVFHETPEVPITPAIIRLPIAMLYSRVFSTVFVRSVGSHHPAIPRSFFWTMEQL